MTLETLRKHQLYAKKSKCRFRCHEIDYLSRIVSDKGVKVDPSKILAMIDWPTPKTLKSLKVFLVLTGYYRKFIKGY